MKLCFCGWADFYSLNEYLLSMYYVSHGSWALGSLHVVHYMILLFLCSLVLLPSFDPFHCVLFYLSQKCFSPLLSHWVTWQAPHSWLNVDVL